MWFLKTMKTRLTKIRNKYNRVKLSIKQFAIPLTTANLKAVNPQSCKFLQSRAEVKECVEFLRRYGFFLHECEPKNWDLAYIIPEIGDGNFLDMGSWESAILKNVALKKIRGELYGIDLQEPTDPIPGVKHTVGDLMDTKLPDKFFKNITCLSVIEHGVDFTKFAQEVSRLLENKGKLFVTFDYWDPKIVSPIKLFGLEWQPLDREGTEYLISECEKVGLKLFEDMDWTTNEQVIFQKYKSPHPEMSYTFGIVIFEKQAIT